MQITNFYKYNKNLLYLRFEYFIPFFVDFIDFYYYIKYL